MTWVRGQHPDTCPMKWHGVGAPLEGTVARARSLRREKLQRGPGLPPDFKITKLWLLELCFCFLDH